MKDLSFEDSKKLHIIDNHK